MQRAAPMFAVLKRMVPRARRYLVLPPAAPGSLGDEAVLTALAACCREKGIGLTALGYRGDAEWDHIPGIDRSVSMRDFYSSSGKRWKVRFLRELFRHDGMIVAGTDVLDGKYSCRESVQRLRLMRVAARFGVPVEVLGVSFNAAPAPECVEMLGTLGDRVTLRARDPVSRDRLSQHLGREIALTADIAFLLPPVVDSAPSQAALRWVKERRAQGRMVVGVNINNHLLGPAGHLSPEVLVNCYAAAMHEMAERRHASFVLLPHDRRGTINDWRLCDLLIARLPSATASAVYVPAQDIRAAEIKGIVGETDCVLTGKMHVAVAALGRGVPVACVTYQDKFEGLMQHFGLDDVLMSGDKACEPGALTEFFERLLARRNTLRAEVASRLPEVTALSMQNVSFL